MIQNLKLAEAVAERDCHVREMLELYRLADRQGITNPRVERCLNEWTNE